MTTASRGPAAELHHTGIVVPDLAAAVAFFVDHLGAEVEFGMDRFIDESGAAVGRIGARAGASFALAMVRLGVARLELLQWWPVAAARESSEPNVVGAVHVGVVVDDVAAALDRLRAVAGVRVLSGPLTFAEGPTPGLTNAFIVAPWGLLVELMSWG